MTRRGRRAGPQGSQLEPFGEQIAAMLANDPTVNATVIRERLRSLRAGRAFAAVAASSRGAGAGQ